MKKCDFPRCKNIAILGYIGRDICEQHWYELCIADEKIEKKLLKKIGLTRTNGGKVIVINGV